MSRLFGRRTPRRIDLDAYPAVVIIRTDGVTVWARPDTDRTALGDTLCQLAAGYSTALAEHKGEL